MVAQPASSAPRQRAARTPAASLPPLPKDYGDMIKRTLGGLGCEIEIEPGRLIALDRRIGEPFDLLAGTLLLGRGEPVAQYIRRHPARACTAHAQSDEVADTYRRRHAACGSGRRGAACRKAAPAR